MIATTAYRKVLMTGLAVTIMMAPVDHVVAAGAAPLRAYATEWNRDAQGMPVAQKERLIELLIARWEGAALRFGADPKTWRDTFGLQLSMLPASTLAALAKTTPENGFQGVVAKITEVLRTAAEKGQSQAKAGTTTDLVFVPINPCRIVDTRFGGGGSISQGSPRDFVYANPLGGTFASQGGSATNCGLVFASSLLSPKAVAATVTVVNATGSGNFVIYPAGSSPGTTSALNYAAGQVLANTTVIVGAQGGAADFTVALNGPPHGADVIVDVVGYYYAGAIDSLSERVSKLEGNITAADLVGTYRISGKQTELHGGAGSTAVASYVFQGTIQLAANGTFTITPTLPDSGNTLRLYTSPPSVVDFVGAGGGDAGTWSYSNGAVTIGGVGGPVLDVAAAGKVLVGVSFGHDDRTDVLFVLSRL